MRVSHGSSQGAGGMGSVSEVRRKARAEMSVDMDGAAFQNVRPFVPPRSPIRTGVPTPEPSFPREPSPTLSLSSCSSQQSSLNACSTLSDISVAQNDVRSAEALRQHALQHTRSFPTMTLAGLAGGVQGARDVAAVARATVWATSMVCDVSGRDRYSGRG